MLLCTSRIYGCYINNTAQRHQKVKDFSKTNIKSISVLFKSPPIACSAIKRHQTPTEVGVILEWPSKYFLYVRMLRKSGFSYYVYRTVSKSRP